MPESFTYPLSEFYTRAKLPLPRIETIPGDAVPEPYRTLLVHGGDMTSRLEEFHRAPMTLRAESSAARQMSLTPMLIDRSSRSTTARDRADFSAAAERENTGREIGRAHV